MILNRGYSPNYQIIVDRVNNTDTFEIKVELTPDMFTDDMGHISKLQNQLVNDMRSMLGIGPKISLVAPKSITRSEGKAVRVIDKRKI